MKIKDGITKGRMCPACASRRTESSKDFFKCRACGYAMKK